MMGFGFGGMMLLGGALLALLLGGTLLVLLVGGAALVFRQTAGTKQTDGYAQPTVRQILDERLAQGEISREEYDLIRTRIE